MVQNNECSSIMTRNKKISESLYEKFHTDEKTKIVVSLVNRAEMTADTVINTLKMIHENGFVIHDTLVTKNLNLILLDGTLDFATQISKLDYVESIDIPPKLTLC